MQARRTPVALALCLALCSMLAAPALAQQDLTEALTRCLLTEEMLRGFDFSEIKEGCDAKLALEDRCERCTCALLDGFVATLEDAGYTVASQNITQVDATVAITNCLDIVVPALAAAGVDTNSIIELAGCSANPSCLTDYL